MFKLQADMTLTNNSLNQWRTLTSLTMKNQNGQELQDYCSKERVKGQTKIQQHVHEEGSQQMTNKEIHQLNVDGNYDQNESSEEESDSNGDFSS